MCIICPVCTYYTVRPSFCHITQHVLQMSKVTSPFFQATILFSGLTGLLAQLQTLFLFSLYCRIQTEFCTISVDPQVTLVPCDLGFYKLICQFALNCSYSIIHSGSRPLFSEYLIFGIKVFIIILLNSQLSQYLVGTGTSVRPVIRTAGDSRTKAIIGFSRKSTSPTSTLEASAPGGIFFMKFMST